MGADTKDEWRSRVLTARRAASSELRAAEDRALEHHVRSIAVPGATVCAYVPTRLEPGTSDLLVALREVAGRVLLPVTGEEGPMKWAEYTGDADLVPAAHGLREPSGPAFEVDEVQTAHTIFVPALAVDRRGVRLGRGAGYYDRSLVLARPGARLITIVRDSEFVDELPEEPHDVRIGWAVTPSAGLRQLSGE